MLVDRKIKVSLTGSRRKVTPIEIVCVVGRKSRRGLRIPTFSVSEGVASTLSDQTILLLQRQTPLRTRLRSQNQTQGVANLLEYYLMRATPHLLLWTSSINTSARGVIAFV
ncbi:hypothetical protein CEXT_88631 [Caerostris extrusa]|uniref:Uncharacterized protein n=1 Tax=Caerostris extrusa TaxID=172846 RepID=A0AAV4XXA5_CAEEX|nr:hypothetical protein CEXT_88631 [Caerostris extrusa]